MKEQCPSCRLAIEALAKLYSEEWQQGRESELLKLAIKRVKEAEKVGHTAPSAKVEERCPDCGSAKPSERWCSDTTPAHRHQYMHVTCVECQDAWHTAGDSCHTPVVPSPTQPIAAGEAREWLRSRNVEQMKQELLETYAAKVRVERDEAREQVASLSAELENIPDKFASAFYVRSDHQYSGVTIHNWLKKLLKGESNNEAD
jgi:hypothetical protein